MTCGTTTTRELYCWGAAGNGLLGEAAMPLNSQRIDHPTMPKQWTNVAMSYNHVCAIGDGDVYCYGDNYNGALGIGRFASSRPITTPTDVGITVQELAAYDDLTCVLAPDGETTKCWGVNSKGQVGNGEIARKTTPTAVRLPTGTVQQLVAGDFHSCALVGETAPYTPYCWGANEDRQVGSAQTSGAESTPKVASSALFSRVAAGGVHNCGIRADGEIECWGGNGSYQLGTMVPSNRYAFGELGDGAWTYIAAGSTASCAIASGHLYCWGSVPGTMNAVEDPTSYGLFGGTSSWTSISLGSGFAVGTYLNGAAPHLAGFGEMCASGRTTNAAPTNADEVFSGFQPITGTPRIAAAQSSGDHTCLHGTMNGTAKLECFGGNGSKQVTAGTAVCGTAYDVMGNWTGEIAMANHHSCAIDAANDLWCWGRDSNFELGTLISGIATPRKVNTMKWSAVATGFDHTCAITQARDGVYCWGENQYGQVGDGTQWEPAPVLAGALP